MDISIAIGRNVGDQPMSAEQWEQYKNDARAIIGRVEAYETGEVNYRDETGFFNDTEEEFARFWATVDDNDILDIRRALRDLAGENGQWGIALSYVATEMIRP